MACVHPTLSGARDKEYFGAKFEDLSPIEFIEDQRLRKLLMLSAVSLSAQDWLRAACIAKAAWEYAARGVYGFLPGSSGFNTPFFIASDFGRYVAPELADGMRRVVGKLFDRIEDAEHFAAMLASGIAVVDYRRFRGIRPMPTSR